MPGLNKENQKKMITAGKKVFFSYFSAHLLEDQIANRGIDSLDCFGEYQKVTNDNGTITITFNPSMAKALEPQIKSIGKYSDKEKQAILAGTTWTVALDPATQKYRLSTEIQMDPGAKSYTIGGAGKLDLYHLHIENLGKMLKQLQTDANSSLLVSMTTGSGKTFTQALLMMVTHLAGIKAFYAVPGKLLGQFQADAAKVVPKEMMDEFQTITKDNVAVTPPSTLITSHEDIFDQHYDAVMALNSESTFLSFDEAHLLSLRESFYFKAQHLVTKFLTLALTATKTEPLTKWLKGRESKKIVEVAKMSNSEKVTAGYAVRAAGHDKSALSTQETAKIAKSSGLGKRLLRYVAECIDPTPDFDLGRTLGDAYLHTVSSKPLKGEDSRNIDYLIRWYLQPSAFQGKMLVCCNRFDDIINIDRMLQRLTPVAPAEGTEDHEAYYANKNLFGRKEVYEFLQQVDNLDGQTLQAYSQARLEQLRLDLFKQIKAIAKSKRIKIEDNEINEKVTGILSGLTNAPISNSMHGIIDLALSVIASSNNGELSLEKALSDYGSVYLDKNRKADLTILTDVLINKAVGFPDDKDKLIRSLTFHQDHNPKGVDQALATGLADIILGVVTTLKRPGGSAEYVNKKKLVDNWFADQTVFDSLSSTMRDSLKKLAIANYKAYSFDHIENDEEFVAEDGSKVKRVPTGADAAFTCLTQVAVTAEHAKVRSKRPVEALNPHYSEVSYTAGPHRFRRQIADNIFRLGIMSFYCTDVKMEGFSDPGLQQVAVVVPSSDNTLIEPAKMVQAYGRNRGLNPTKVPNFFQVTNHGVKPVFGIAQLDKDDFSRDYTRSFSSYKKLVLKKQAVQLADNLLAWIKSNPDFKGTFDDEELSSHVCNLLFDVLEEANKANAFKFKLASTDFATILNTTEDILKKRQAELKKGTQLTLFVRTVAVLSYTLARIFFNFESKPVLDCLKKNKPNAEDKVATLYYKIITNIGLEKNWKVATEGLLAAEKLQKSVQKSLEKLDAQLVVMGAMLNSKDIDLKKMHSDINLFFSNMISPYLNDESFKKAIKHLDGFSIDELQLILGDKASAEALKNFCTTISKKKLNPQDFFPKTYAHLQKDSPCPLNIQRSLQEELGKLKDMWPNIQKVFTLVSGTHSYFYQIDPLKQGETDFTLPVLFSDVNKTLTDIKMPTNGNMLWRQFFSLRHLQNILPTINRLTFMEHGGALQKARQVSRFMFLPLAQGKKPKAKDCYSTKASAFLREIDKERQCQIPNPLDKLDGAESTVAKLKGRFTITA